MGHRWEPMLDELVRSRYPRLLMRALMLTGSHADAEDLVQEALVASFSGGARFSSLGEAEHYVRRAIASRSVDRARRAARSRTAERRLAALAVHPTEIELPGLTRQVVDALATLPPQIRACVVLRHLEDLSVRETSDALGVSEGAVKRYTSDGVRALNAILGTVPPSGEPVLLTTTEVHGGA
ncbi:sigma-70 family RNA polymerase sigma factor [Cellulomonas gelida]|uniref:RNA polymerase sigma factor n=1 Tax=Cellulomonas gelida TaxID=1712 RepID=A0A4Y3KM13_9CELL|nr:sigma-70 family RNA polymerase sigma factor [Cellulomonas gelida]GEA84696.1 RNA polymerase sigma factor [Cellulomonas gelida]GGL20729.1 RNA polymerase sigma factor [Cellulomonas gelida]